MRSHRAIAGDLGDVPALIGRLEDADPVVRLAAHEELRRRTGRDFGFVPWAEPGGTRRRDRPMAGLAGRAAQARRTRRPERPPIEPGQTARRLGATGDLSRHDHGGSLT